MATVKPKFRPSTVDGKEGTLFYRIIHNRRSHRIRTGYKLFPSEWDERSGGILIPPGSDEGRKNYLAVLQDRVAGDTDRLNRIIASYEQELRTYTYADILADYSAPEGADTLFGFMKEMIGRLRRQGRIRTCETYDTTLRNFNRFRKGRDMRFGEIDSEIMVAYELHLKMTGVSKNTSSFYLRILRAVYNRAVEEGFCTQRHPFKHVYTGIAKTAKRALALDALRRIRDMELASRPQMDYARNMFLLSFYQRGMSFVDMAYLKREDLQNGMLTYCRKKTGQRLSIRWEPCMQQIVERYPNGNPAYLLPILVRSDSDERRQYKNVGHLINRNLRKLGRELGLAVPLTMYVARHTWASVARSRNIPLSVISESMGHDSEATTRIYLASLDTAVVDQANRLVINSLSEEDPG